MKIKIKVSNITELNDLNNIVKKMIILNSQYIDYIEFYNTQCILKTIADQIYKQNYFLKRNCNLSLEINQFKTFINLKKMSENYLSQDENIFYQCLVFRIFEDGIKQIDHFKLNQQYFNDNSIETIKDLYLN